jgi:hypothetical protein
VLKKKNKKFFDSGIDMGLKARYIPPLAKNNPSGK